MITKFLKSIWNEFVYGGHLLSLGAASIVFTSAILLGIKITWDCLLVVYLGAQIIYLYNRYKEFQKDSLTNPERTKHIKKYIKYTPLIIFCFIVILVGILIYFNKIVSLFFGLIMLFLGLFYSISLKNLTKKIIAFKTIFVSLMWALLVIFLAIYYSFPLNLAVVLVFVFIFLRLFINTNFFDIKDIESDKKEGLLTTPIVLGQKKLINMLSVVSVLSIIPIGIGLYYKLFPTFSIMLLFTIFYTFLYFQKIKNKNFNTDFLFSVWVDGEYLLWSVFILIGKFIL